MYRYLGVNILNYGRMNEKENHTIGDARKTVNVFTSLWKRRHVSKETKHGLYEEMVEPALLHRCEVWLLNFQEHLYSICGVRRFDRQ